MTNLPPPPPSLPPPPLHSFTQKGGERSLTETLLSTTSAADARNRVATLMFQNIAAVLDEAISEDTALPQHLKKDSLFAAVVATPSLAAAPKASRPKNISPPIKPAQATNKGKIAKPHKDNRLLVRVAAGHPALNISPYAVMEQLNNFLNQKLVREVQLTKTGFAICPASVEAQEILVTKIPVLQGFLSSRGQCTVEKPENHAAYRISGVPRNYIGYNKQGAVEAIEIDADTVSQALVNLTHVAPLKVLESRGTLASEFSPCKSWIVLYPQASNLARSLPIFGVRATTKLLPQRTKIPQCGRCYGWHNERSCARVPRCRICSSSLHLEANHISCNPAVAHVCPPKCVNCHGPHPADSLECLLRPKKDNTFPNKQQTSTIRQAAAAARLRLKAAHCGVVNSQAAETSNSVAATPPATLATDKRPVDFYRQRRALEAAELWKSRPRLPHISEGQIHIRWVPGHVGIKGNEFADLEAKKGAAMPSPHPPEFSFSSLRRWHTEQNKIARDKWWQTSRPPAYTQLEIANAPIFHRELLLCRKDLGRVLAARMGHGDFAAYHTRFNHEDATLNCLCGSAKSPTVTV
ncbi:hypothetical protein K3495_g3162 [Podosphaera aphanis]|nr:hypothetical protein K3495_g3162 [Podosphaera aphanis]